MSDELFPDLPGATRTWVFALDGQPEHCKNALDRVKSFLKSWQSHGREVLGQATLVNQRILIVCGLVLQDQVSGCSIDALTRAVTMAAQEAGCQLVSPMKISYQRADGSVAYASRPAFRQLLKTGEVTPDTPVFDLAVCELQGVRNGQFVLPLAQSPFARVFRV